MTRTTVRKPCHVCEGTGEVLDERGIAIVCGACLGQCFKDENPDGPVCDVERPEQ